jgi:glycosyltransferase Alg8
MALGKRVLTLTGRMSLLRAEIATNPEFIADVEADAIDHWRLGRFRFLTGDDKSTWYSTMRLGWDTYYVPDASVRTMEHPPDKRFWGASRKLMFRWFGNSLSPVGRALKLGRKRLGWFTTYVLLDQRVSMWTSLIGPVFVLTASLKHRSWLLLLGYMLWIGSTRLLMSLLLRATGHPIGPAFPMLLYYNQMVGSLMKIRVSFYLDQQSWTRQNTRLNRNLDRFQRWFNPWSSRLLLFSAASLFVALLIRLAMLGEL